MSGYVNKSDLMAAVVEAKQLDELTPRLAEYLQKIATGLSNHRWFSGFSIKEDLASVGLLQLVASWRSFDETHPAANPFAYYTRAAQSAVMKHLDKERIQWQLIEEEVRDQGLSDEHESKTKNSLRQQHWLDEVKAMRIKYQAKETAKAQLPEQPDAWRFPWKPASPASFVFDLPDNEPTDIQLTRAYDRCNELNLTPTIIILRRGTARVEVPFDLNRRVQHRRRLSTEA